MKESTELLQLSSSSLLTEINNNDEAVTAELNETITTEQNGTSALAAAASDHDNVALVRITNDMKGSEDNTVKELDFANNEHQTQVERPEPKQEHQDSLPQEQQQRIVELEAQLKLVSHWLYSVTSSSNYAGDKEEGCEIRDVGSQINLVDAIITDLCIQNEEILDRLYEFEMMSSKGSPEGPGGGSGVGGGGGKSLGIKDTRGPEESRPLSAVPTLLGRKLSIGGRKGSTGGTNEAVGGGGGVVDGSLVLESVRMDDAAMTAAAAEATITTTTAAAITTTTAVATTSTKSATTS